MPRVKPNTNFYCGFRHCLVPMYCTRDHNRRLVPDVCLRSHRQIVGGDCHDSRCIFNGGRQQYLSEKGEILAGWRL